MLEDPFGYEDTPHEVCMRRRVVAWLAIILGIVIASVVVVAHADEPKVTFVADLGGNKLFIYPEPCQLGGWFAQWKKARWVINGEPFEACWRLQRDNDGISVHTVDAAGDPGKVHVSLFKPVESI